MSKNYIFFLSGTAHSTNNPFAQLASHISPIILNSLIRLLSMCFITIIMNMSNFGLKKKKETEGDVKNHGARLGRNHDRQNNNQYDESHGEADYNQDLFL